VYYAATTRSITLVVCVSFDDEMNAVCIRIGMPTEEYNNNINMFYLFARKELLELLYNLIINIIIIIIIIIIMSLCTLY